MRSKFRFLILILAGCAIWPALTEARAPQSGKEATHNRRGMDYFHEAFYERLPKGQQKEADRAFENAMVEFHQAIALKPDFVEAHRNLARLFWVRKQYPEAAESYRAVTRLVPRDLDAHVQLALAYVEMNRFQEAERQLELAKTRTGDPEAIRKLDGYIQKIREQK